MGSTSSFDLSSCQADEFHYFEDVYFIIGKTRFKIPRHHFDDSPHFRKLFDQAQGTSELTSPGGSIVKESRIHFLNDTSIKEFQQLLRVLYPRNFEGEVLTPAQWVSVLKLSWQWKFEKVRELAIKNLEGPLSNENGCLELLTLGFLYEVDKWLLPALRLLVEKKKLEEEEFSSIGLGMSVRIISLQNFVAGVRSERTKNKKELSQTEIDEWIKRAFPEVSLPRETSGSGGNGGNGSGNGKGQKKK